MMGFEGKTGRGPLVTALLLMGLFLAAPDAAAAEQAAHWRGIYDVAMKWLNFGILAFLIIKFARVPLRDFLTGEKAKVADEIEKLEKKKESTLHKINDTRKLLAEGDRRLAALKEKMIRQGGKEKEKIIEAARVQSRMMLEGAQRKVENRIRQTKLSFRSELIDAAMGAAIQQLPAQVTDEDNRKLLEIFLSDAK